MMGLCVVEGSGGAVTVQSPQPSDISTCSMVLISGAEYQSAASSPWNLTLSEAGAIGGAIVIVWAAGWASRTLIRAFQSIDSEHSA